MAKQRTIHESIAGKIDGTMDGIDGNGREWTECWKTGENGHTGRMIELKERWQEARRQFGARRDRVIALAKKGGA